MSLPVITDYLSIGGNRQSAASAWSTLSGVLAFGADQNVAIWRPLNPRGIGITNLLRGHNDRVTAVSFCQPEAHDVAENLLTGSADGQLLLWTALDGVWSLSVSTQAHLGASINSIATFDGSDVFASGGSNAEVKVWRSKKDSVQLLTTIKPRPNLIPLALALGRFSSIDSGDNMFLTVGGTRNDVQLYSVQHLSTKPTADLQATLKGHEGWIHSLAIRTMDDHSLLLASASADKYVRLWRFRPYDGNLPQLPAERSAIGHEQPTLSAKVQTLSGGDAKYAVSFEALLLGHEDWVYTASWNPQANSDQLLTASADGSLSIWEPDPSSGIWISVSKLGEISGQKGATTATGSAGGFWTGLWSPNGQAVTCLGRTGSWRVWEFDKSTNYWVQKVGVGGHISPVNSVVWPDFGEYLLSTSSDQTTRLHAEWRRVSKRTWHEFCRPQIHGYDLNCLASTGAHQFVSGADEKLLRVFNEPRDIALMLRSLCNIAVSDDPDLPDVAAIPVLGLSNKALGEEDDSMNEIPSRNQQDYAASNVLDTSIASIKEPPTEDILARHTLWPEQEKLYGHGYEISECASSNQFLATSCKASSTDHAVIRLYNTTSWTEMKPALTAHSLTVTRLAWSLYPDFFLLSVGRDRQWAVFTTNRDDNNDDEGKGGNHSDKPKHQNELRLLQSNLRAHSRMILDVTWSPIGGQPFFATAARDKTIKVWHCEYRGMNEDGNREDPNFLEWETIKRDSSVTSVDFTCNYEETFAVLAAGEESGQISIHIFDVEHHLSLIKSVNVPLAHCPSKSINRLSWRSNSNAYASDGVGQQLAVAAADGSVRILGINVEDLCSDK